MFSKIVGQSSIRGSTPEASYCKETLPSEDVYVVVYEKFKDLPPQISILKNCPVLVVADVIALPGPEILVSNDYLNGLDVAFNDHFGPFGHMGEDCNEGFKFQPPAADAFENLSFLNAPSSCIPY